jgi:hypothetical protein
VHDGLCHGHTDTGAQRHAHTQSHADRHRYQDAYSYDDTGANEHT